MTQVLQHGTSWFRTAAAIRSTAYLSDGSIVFAFLDVNQNDTSGDYGDGTGISKLYIYHSPANRSSWTLKNTLTIGTTVYNGEGEAYSIAVDASNNLHIAYTKRSDQSIQYIKGTYSAGPTWSMSAPATAIAAPSSNIVHTRVDIDCISTGDNPVIMAFVNDYNGAGATSAKITVKNNSAVWATPVTWTLTGGAGPAFNGSDDISIAASQEASPDSSGYHYICATATTKTTGGDQGGRVLVYRVLLSTGVVSNGYVFFSGMPALRYRVFYDHAASNNKYWVIAGYSPVANGINYNLQTFAVSFHTDLSNNPYTDAPMVSFTNGSTVTSNSGHSPVAITYNKVSKRILWQWASPTNSFMTRTAAVNASDIAIRTVDSASYWVAAAFVAYGNAQSRNTDATSVDVLLKTDQPYEIQHAQPLLTSAVSYIKTPASGSTINTARPSMVPRYSSLWTVLPRVCKTEFQFASDGGFTTNLTDFVEDDSFLQSSSAPTDGPPYTLTSSLAQGTWYARSRLLDDFGGVGPWQTLASPYTITHPPSATNLQPGTGTQVYMYGSPTTFSWTFGDTSLPWDSQTAFQVVVERVSDGAAIYDTGKVSSSGTSTSITIGSSYKDINLRWKVRLWDAANVAGSYVVSSATFQVTSAPVVTVTNPTGSINTAIPVVTWTNGINSPKTQSSYRVSILSGSTTVYDSDWILGSNLSYSIPLGFLANGGSYTVSVEVSDSLGLHGTGTSTFTVSFTPPTVPTGAATAAVYLFEYANRGFVYISMSTSGADTDFLQYNLYRRKFGASSWDLLTSWSNLSQRLVYQDFTALAGQTYEYSVTQVVNRYGDIFESAKSTLRIPTPNDEKYWLFSNTDVTKSMPLLGVTDDGYTEEYESETYNIIGRGRHIDFGDRLGLVGNITVKLRDRMTTGVAKVNYLKNPKFTKRSGDSADPSLWTSASGGTVGSKSVIYATAQEPTPCGTAEAVGVRASAMGTATTDYVEITQAISQADMPMLAATNFIFSFYVGGTVSQVNFVAYFTYYNSSNALLSTSTMSNLSPYEYYFPTPGVGDVDYGLTGNFWTRYYQAGVTPTNYDHMNVTVRMRGIGSGTAGLTKTMLLSSGLLELSSTGTPAKYIDGSQIGGQWRGDEDLSSSETTGFYTARQMKKDIESFKAQKEYGFLRTPFGDLYSVALGNVSLKRIAGVAQNEFADVDIPYTEVGF